MKNNQKWFSIVEVLIGILIFSLWLVSIYMLILSSMKMNEYSKNSIIASNLAREGIENIRNVRDNNYNNLYKWNQMPWEALGVEISTGVYFTLETDLSTDEIKMKKIDNFWEWKNYLKDRMKSYQLYLTPEKTYTYASGSSNSPTYFYRYVYFDDVKSNTGMLVKDALKLKSKVIWYKNGYHEIELDTVLTHFQRD